MHSDALTIAAWLGLFVYGYLNAMIGIVLPNLMEKLKVDVAQAGTFFLFVSIGLIVSTVPSGPAMDSFGTKMIVCIGLALVALSFWGLGAISDRKFLYPLGIVLGLGGAMIVAGENTLVALINVHQREVAASFLNLFFGAGAFLAPFLVIPMLKRRGFTGVLRMSSLIAAVVLAVHAGLRFPAAQQPQGFPLANAGEVLGQPQLLLLAFLALLYVGTEFSVWSWTVTYFTQARQFNQKSASHLIAYFALAMIAGRYCDKWLLASAGPTRTILISVAASIVFLSALYRLRNPKAIRGAALAAGFSMAAIYPTAIGMAGALFPQLTGTAISFVITGGWIGAILIPPAVGFIANRKGVRHAIFIPIASCVLMLITPMVLLYAR